MKNNVKISVISLFVIQLANYLSPLLVIPFLTRTFGPEGFGILAMIFSSFAILLVFTDYGFNFISPYKIARNQTSKNYISDYVSSIIIIKCIIVFILSIIILFYTFYFNYSIDIIIYFFIGFISQSLQINWFYQGVEKLKVLTLATVTSKVLYLVVIVSFVSHDDLNIVILFYSFSFFIVTFISWLWYFKNGYKLVKQPLSSVRDVLIEASPFFLSRFFVALYTSANTIIIGNKVSVVQAGYFSSSEKIYQAGQSLSSPITQALFPHLSKTKDVRLFFKVFFYLFIGVIITANIAFLYSSTIIYYLFGPDFLGAKNLLEIFIIIGVVNFAGSFFGYPAFSIIERLDIANKTVILGGIVHLSILLFLYINDILLPSYIVSSILIAESVVMTLRVVLFIIIYRTNFEKNY